MHESEVTGAGLPGLLARVRKALAGEFDVHGEIAAGGMGVVFLAHDLALDRRVAIKVLRPELAGALAAERFVREARLLASLSHPHIVPVHKVGEQDGLFFMVMEYLDGHTLGERLASSGPLSPREAVACGAQLLEALGALHARGIVHRDIKPANAFLVRGRGALLGDFGIAKATDSEDLTAPGAVIGTPAYMAPEQRTGGTVTPRADLYAMGALLYECVAGQPWPAGQPPHVGYWRPVPRRLAAVLRRALALGPEDRWPDAASFAQALVAAGRPLPRLALAGTALAIVAGVGLGLWVAGRDVPDTMTADLAVLPFRVAGGTPSAVGDEVARLAAMHVEGGLPTGQLTLVPIAQAFRHAEVAGDSLPPPHARAAVRGFVEQAGDSLTVRVVYQPVHGVPDTAPLVRGSVVDPYDLGYAVGLAIVRLARPTAVPNYRGSAMLAGRRSEAIRAFVAGEAAFQREMWTAADAHYTRAIALDSGFAIAWWRLYNVRTWRRVDPGFALQDLADRGADQFFATDRQLLAAMLARPGPERFARFADAVTRAPYDAYALMHYGSEMFHRGALVGFDRDTAVAILRRSVEADSLLAPAWSTLAWAALGAGDAATARVALDTYHRIAAPRTEADFCLGCFLQLAWVERFAPEQVAGARAALLENPAAPGGAAEMLARALRWAPSVGLPQTQLELAGFVARAPGLDEAQRETAIVAEALALFGLGRPEAAFARFRDAAAVRNEPMLVRQAELWPRVTAALLADSVGDWPAGDDPLAQRVRRALAARDPTELGALRRELLHQGRKRLPFARTAVMITLGRVLALETAAAGDSVWRYYEAADLDEFPTGPAQAGEVDWAFGPWVALLRAERSGSCALVRETARRWTNAEPGPARRLADVRRQLGC